MRLVKVRIKNNQATERRNIKYSAASVPQIILSSSSVIVLKILNQLNIPSYSCKAGDIIAYKTKSLHNSSITSKVRGKNAKISWLDWNETEKKGTFITYPEREAVPENIKEQLIVELYSK